MSCGCAERKEIMFTQGHPDWTCIVVLIGVPASVYLLGRMVAK